MRLGPRVQVWRDHPIARPAWVWWCPCCHDGGQRQYEQALALQGARLHVQSRHPRGDV